MLTYGVPVRIDAGSRIGAIASTQIDLVRLFGPQLAGRTPDYRSLRLRDSYGSEYPLQFSPGEQFHPVEHAIGTLTTRLPSGCDKREWTLCLDASDAVRVDPPYPRVQIHMEPREKLSIRIDGEERLGYWYGPDAPKTYFYPVIGPAGQPITSCGDTESPEGHHHHRSLWIEHESVNGVCFEWAEPGAVKRNPSAPPCGRIVHERFGRIEDGPIYAGFYEELAWVSEDDSLTMRERRGVRIVPLDGGELFIDLQITLIGGPNGTRIGQSAYGILALRVQRWMSVTHGGGQVRNGIGGLNESEMMKRRAPWCDYSGPVSPNEVNGIAVFDHPDNPGHPNPWFVRDGGWMSASPFAECNKELAPDEPMTFCYRVFVHREDADTRSVGSAYYEYANPLRIEIQPERNL